MRGMRGRMPWSSKKASNRIGYSVPVGGEGGVRNPNLPSPSRPEDDDIEIRCDQRVGIPYPEWNAWTESFLPGHVEELNVPEFRGGRPCRIYLPPGYATSNLRYPVLYLNDGQQVFDPGGAVQANRICEDLIRGGEIVPIIMVAISIPPQPDTVRFWDYAPWQDFYHGRFLGGGGDTYVRAVRDTLKPEIDRRFRTLSDAAHTGIAGYSLGGLISAYAGLAYPGTFGLVGACSPTYGWSLSADDIYTTANIGGYPQLLTRYYQDTGYPDDNDIGRMEQVLVSHRFVNGLNLMSVTEDGAEHSVPAWKHRFPGMLRFLFRP